MMNLETEIDMAPLKESAALAHSLSKQYCSAGCSGYHGVWIYARLFGAMNSVRRNYDDFVSALRVASENKKAKILISASSDFGILACLLEAYRDANYLPEITVVDQCETPLKLNQWYAKREGIKIQTQVSNLLTFAETGFDLIVGHNILNFFHEDERPKLFNRWHENLGDNGWAIIANNIKPNVAKKTKRFNEAGTQNFVNQMLEARISKGFKNEISADELEALVRDFAANRYSLGVTDYEKLILDMKEAGLHLLKNKRGNLAASYTTPTKGSYRATLTLEKK